MHYLLAIICPPVAILLYGPRPNSFLISILLTSCFIIPGIIHAIIVVRCRMNDLHMNQKINAIINAQNP